MTPPCVRQMTKTRIAQIAPCANGSLKSTNLGGLDLTGHHHIKPSEAVDRPCLGLLLSISNNRPAHKEANAEREGMSYRFKMHLGQGFRRILAATVCLVATQCLNAYAHSHSATNLLEGLATALSIIYFSIST